MISFVLLFYSRTVFATPSSQEIYDYIFNAWTNRNFTQIDQYISTLYNNNQSYIPAIIAKSFHDAVWEGDLLESLNKLNSIKIYMETNSLETDSFYNELTIDILNLEREWNMHFEEGRTLNDLKANASPSAVRNLQVPEVLGFTPVLRLIKQALQENIN
jgi:hypothetical protein